jgi:hypothetical protein
MKKNQKSRVRVPLNIAKVALHYTKNHTNCLIYCKMMLNPLYTVNRRAAEALESRDSLLVSLKGTPGSPDSWAKAVLNIDSNLRSNSIRFFLLDYAKIKILFYCHGVGKITYDRCF